MSSKRLGVNVGICWLHLCSCIAIGVELEAQLLIFLYDLHDKERVSGLGRSHMPTKNTKPSFFTIPDAPKVWYTCYALLAMLVE